MLLSPRQIYRNSISAIPAFDFWSLTVMIFCIVSGIRGLAGQSIAYLALENYAIYWHISLIVAPIIYMAGKFSKPPNGFLISMIGALIIFGSSFGVYIGLSLAMNNWLFSGFATVLIFGVGSLFSFIQMFNQLYILRRGLLALNGDKRDS